ncbi:uncharacterized protein LOC131207422 [Anopheles bellator]|uniref:uncharacterized protein LOC131207422 n=1 Tax=Anopheles bellator TaxID=139047 RepID=UPI002649BDF6|nr:uncharacterized protein LOC131207422 [Anopheles bellator]
MNWCRCLLLLSGVLAVCGAPGNGQNETPEARVTHLDLLRRLTSLRGVDIRKNLRSLRELAMQHGLIRASGVNRTSVVASREEQSAEMEESSQETASEPGQDLTATVEGRKKGGGGGGGSNNIVVANGGGGGLGGHDDISISIEDGGNKKGKRGKKGKKGKKHRRRKRKGWKKHMKKAVPIGVGILALKALLLHFLLKKLVMATALSLLLSKKSLLVSSLIALKLLLQHPHTNDKSESSKLEVVHIPIRKETGFHKKHQQQKYAAGKLKQLAPPAAPASTAKPAIAFEQFEQFVDQHPIQHAHQQMADFGGKYIPLGYETNHFHFDATPTSFNEALGGAQNVDQFFDDTDELQFDRKDGWDGWSGWNRGEEPKRYQGHEAGYGWDDYGPQPQDYQQPAPASSYNSYQEHQQQLAFAGNRSKYGAVLDEYGGVAGGRQQTVNRRKRKF